jgi:hypothetical protein
LVNVVGLALIKRDDGAVFLSKSTVALVTPDTFSSAFLTVIGQTAHDLERARK